jgi:exopolyphosphatase/guanosine-5'-triphosphate,3'-diphosphate pyrophosphatase
MVMGTILKVVKPGKVVVSGFGLREGLAFDRLFGAGERPDLLLAMCRELARTRGRFGDHGDEIQEWVAPLFAGETEDRQRLHHVTCLLSDIGWAGHPDYRAEMVLSDVLHSQLVGVDHAGRAFMAIALYVCYGGKIEKAPLAATMPALPAETVKEAEILGLALRLAQRISGGTEGILAKCDLTILDNKLSLHIQPGNTHLVSEVVERRLRNLAIALGKDFEIRS